MKLYVCPVCQSKKITDAHIKNGHVFSTCGECQLVFMNPHPAVDNLVDNFLTEKTGYHTKLDKDLSKIKKFSKFFTGVVEGLKKMGASGTLLDVGCSNGEFMFLAKKNGFDVYGVEVNKDTTKIATNNGLNVFRGTLQEAKFPNDYFSVICLLGVVGSVSDPTAFLKECQRILKKGGIIVASESNTDSFWMKATNKLHTWFGFPWSVIVPYYHPILFSDTGFKKLFQEAGFNIKEVQYPFFPLRHELGCLHLLEKVKKEKSIKSFLYMVLVFSVYSFVYFINLLLSPFLKKSFKMIVFATKD